jgi:hypothetical protein
MNGRILAEVREYQELIDAFKAWMAELNVCGRTVDDVAGLPDRYTAKLLAPVPIKGIGRTSLGPLLGALGLKLIVAVDHEVLERMRHRLDQRSEADVKRVTANARSRMLAGSRRKNTGFKIDVGIAKALQCRWMLLTTPRQRARIARGAAKARWRQYRLRSTAAG